MSFDWRGQGISDKMINNNHKQFIDDFNIHHNDLEVILNNFIKKNFPGPLIGIGHSMGGCILLSFLKTHNDVFDRVILSAPMLGFRNEKLLMPFISLANILFPKKSYLIGSKPNMGKETLFEDNDLTTDEGRYLRTLKLVRKKPEIRLWGITNAWANAAKKEILLMRKDGWAEDIRYKILFLNNPTRGIDIKSKSEIYGLIHSLSKQGKGIILISSEIEELIENCHRIIVMNKGIQLDEYQYDQFSNQKILHSATMA